MADDILIDLGDLLSRVPIEKILFLQRRIMSLACSVARTVYVGTNVLEFMVIGKFPNWAEMNDTVLNLEICTGGLVATIETTIGQYLVAAVSVVRALMSEYGNWTPQISIEEILDR